MRWGHLLLRGAVHLIGRLRRQLPLIGEATGVHAVGAALCSARAGGTGFTMISGEYVLPFGPM